MTINGTFSADYTPEWDAVDNKPDTFPPTQHGHSIADVEGLAELLAEWAESPAPSSPVGPSAVLDVEAKFGGGWAGVKAACAEAQTSGGPSAYVLMGKGYDATSTISITRPFTLAGSHTRLRHSGSFAGELFRLENLKRSNQWESTQGTGPIQTYDGWADKGGMVFRDFAIIDNDRSVPNRRGIYCLDVDDMRMSNLTFGYLTGTALKLGADEADAGLPSISSGRIRESNFTGIHIRRCGSGSPSGSPDIPALIIQNASSDGDGTNQNYFTHLRFVYNEGRMLMRGPGYGGNSLRRTIFRDCQFHALADNKNWVPTEFFPFDMITLEGAVRETLFDGAMVNGNRAGTAMFRIKGHPSNAAANMQPKDVMLRNINVVNVHGSLVKVDKCDTIHLDGMHLGAAEGMTLDIAPDSGLVNYSVHGFGTSSPAGKVTRTVGKGTVEHHGMSV